MSHHRNIGDLAPEFNTMNRCDFQDMEARNLANEAESMNRAYANFTTEQADDLARALYAIQSMLGRVMQ
jgi:hypothetical protein